MSFDEIAQKVFANPGLALLAAGGCARMVARTLPPEERAPFEGFHAALRDWFPTTDRKRVKALYEEWWEPCMNVRVSHGDNDKHPSGIAMNAVYLQLRAIFPLVGGVLPRDGFYDMSEDDFVRICRSSAKGTSITAVGHRFKTLLAKAKRPWEDQCALSDRMAWGSPIKETRLPSRLRPLALDLSSGAKWEFVDMYGAQLLRVKGLKTTHNAQLSEEQRATLSEMFTDLKPSDS